MVLDTTVFIHHDLKFEELNIASILGTRADPIRILLPMMVIDELDGQKRAGRDEARWRAGHATAVIDRRVTWPAGEGVLRSDGVGTLMTGGDGLGEVTLRVLLDPPGHVRLPIPNDEIIDRALAAQLVAGRPVTLVTYDTGQNMRAQAAGLTVIS
ncbi:PIN domain-containing protein [Micromonospora zingiberis]|uniref:PIN domain-containing protein n=1 Tax=Micromonospora zingiberis TaxID=2053011 RepID=UPI0013F467EE|nr:PIN domain-containing protein [Micromonospora zingiberis]